MTTTANTPYRSLGDVPYSYWHDTIINATGPEALASRETWQATRPHSLLAMRMLLAESTYGNDFRGNPEGNRNPWNIKWREAYGADRRGEADYVKYGTWIEAAADWKRHITEPPYDQLTTIAELVHSYAPGSDGNSEKDYVKKITTGADTLPRYEVYQGGGIMATPVSLDWSVLSFPVQIKLIPKSQTRQRPGNPMVPKSSTWHDTQNTDVGADSDMHAQYLANGCPDNNGNPTQTSWHLSIDDEKAIQHLPLNEIAWHAADGDGPGNMTSIAAEECVNQDRNPQKTRAHAAELHGLLQAKLHLDTTWQHNHWSGKDCPHTVRALNLWPSMQTEIARWKAHFLGALPTDPPADPVVIVPGIDLGVATRLFGTVIGEDGSNYRFDPEGPVSKLWLDQAKKTGEWPALVSVWIYDGGNRRYFRFSNGSLILVAKGAGPVIVKGS